MYDVKRFSGDLQHMKILARFLAVSVLTVGSVVALTGCCKKSSSSGSSSSGSTGETVNMSSAKIKFDAPAGWVRRETGRWTQYMAPDKLASLAFVTFDKPGESTSLIGQMAGVLGVGAVSWQGSQSSANLGRGGFPSKIGEGTCQINGNGDPCYVWYATVNPGTSTQVLIVYAVNTKAGSHHKANAKASVDSLRAL